MTAEGARNASGAALVLLVLLAAAAALLPARGLNVSYDDRALLLDGKRRLLISAGIHYPRATPQMWPNIIGKAKEGGANVVQTYVFWSGHEPQKGQYYFEERYDLVKFARTVAAAGLYLNLRIGPYACAEWNFGGFPTWLRHVPGIEFRTDNEQFKEEMATFVRLIVTMMKENKLFAWQGGPIILAQIENEYGNIQASFGDRGHEYVKWAAEFAVGLQTGVPWIMCQQWDTPPNIITTCNGYYCDGYKPSSPGTPIMWTEDWNGWFQLWGSTLPHRPVQDQAFAVARFFQRGGSYHNYYMYFGGTNFERTSGGPYITTSYDYDAPIDEYGLTSQPKWGHLKELHEVLYLVEEALVASDEPPQYISFGKNLEGHVYSISSEDSTADRTQNKETCVAFLANIDASKDGVVNFRGSDYELPAWSVSILLDCKTVVYNTAKIGVQTSIPGVIQNSGQPLSYTEVQSNLHGVSAPLSWEAHEEPVGGNEQDAFAAKGLLEQIITTKDLTDYLWYVTRFEVSEDDAKQLSTGAVQANISLGETRDAIHVFVNGELAGSFAGRWISVDQPVNLREGENEISLLCMTVGLTNYGAFLEKESAGVRKSVKIRGLPSGDLDLTSANWVYQVGLKGEKQNIFSPGGAAKVSWTGLEDSRVNKPLTWYKTKFPSPDGQDPVTLDLGSMGKGQLFVNGRHLGRYWPSILAPEDACSKPCDYRGAYNPEKCVTQCGKPTQQWYHAPREWLNTDVDNLLVLFEEMGGDPSSISVGTRAQHVICADISDSHSPPLNTWIASHGIREYHRAEVPEMRLECGEGQHISAIVFASFGDSMGACDSFRRGGCHASTSDEVVQKACKGRRRCSIPVSAVAFGGDPCPGQPKSLTVQATCTHADKLSNGSYLKTDQLSTVRKGKNWTRSEDLFPINGNNRWQMGQGSGFSGSILSVLMNGQKGSDRAGTNRKIAQTYIRDPSIE